jgi:hypothetical protein
MSSIELQEALESFTKLTDTLQDCIKSHDIEGAMALAKERHDALVNLLEDANVDQTQRENCADTTLEHLRKEQLLAKSNSDQNRSDFIARKSAYRAYAPKAA